MASEMGESDAEAVEYASKTGAAASGTGESTTTDGRRMRGMDIGVATEIKNKKNEVVMVEEGGVGVVEEGTGRCRTGAWMWDCAPLLAQFLAQEEEAERGVVRGARVLELGAGCTGLPGLAAALLGAASVTLTDRLPLLPALRRSVAANPYLSHLLRVRALHWEDSLLLGSHHSRIARREIHDPACQNPDQLTREHHTAYGSMDLTNFHVNPNPPPPPHRHTPENESHPNGTKEQLQQTDCNIDLTTRREPYQDRPEPSDFGIPEILDLDLDPGFDVVLLSDVLYDVESMPALLRTLVRASKGGTQIFLAYELRLSTFDCLEALREGGHLLMRETPRERIPEPWRHNNDLGIIHMTLAAPP